VEEQIPASITSAGQANVDIYGRELSGKPSQVVGRRPYHAGQLAETVMGNRRLAAGLAYQGELGTVRADRAQGQGFQVYRRLASGFLVTPSLRQHFV
jgi:hypothetical protein